MSSTPVKIPAASAPPGVWQLLRRNRLAVLSMAALAFITLAAIFGPMLMSASAAEITKNQLAPPSWAHPFGTDLHGQDLLYRVLTGARVSLAVGCAGAIVALFIGTAYGLVSG